MKTCSKCNAPNQDDFAFCERCGARLDEVQNIQQTGADNLTGSPSTTADTIPDGQIPADQTPASPAAKKSPIGKIAIGAAVVVVLLFIISLLFSNPTYKLLRGLAKLSKMDKVTTVTTVDIKYDGDNEQFELLNDVTVKANIAADIKNLFAESSLDLLYENKSVVKTVAGINNEILYIDPLKLYKKKFYQELEEVIPEYTDNIEAIKVIIKSLEGVKLKANPKKYADIIKDVLDDDIKGSGNKVTVTMSYKTAMKLTEAILEEAADDEKLMESIRTNAISVVKKLLKEKKKIKDIIDEDDLEEALEYLEDKDEFEDAYQQGIDEALSGLKYARNGSILTAAFPDVEVTFVFGLFNNIKGINYKLEADIPYTGEFAINVKSEIKSGAKFTKINKKDAINLQDISEDPDEFEEVAEEIAGNLVKTIKSNKGLTKKIEDVTGEDIEDIEELLLENIF